MKPVFTSGALSQHPATTTAAAMAAAAATGGVSGGVTLLKKHERVASSNHPPTMSSPTSLTSPHMPCSPCTSSATLTVDHASGVATGGMGGGSSAASASAGGAVSGVLVGLGTSSTAARDDPETLKRQGRERRRCWNYFAATFSFVIFLFSSAIYIYWPSNPHHFSSDAGTGSGGGHQGSGPQQQQHQSGGGGETAPRVAIYSYEYFALCMIGGLLSGIPHILITPIDVVKCRMQVGCYNSYTAGFNDMRAEANAVPQGGGGYRMALFNVWYRGWAPTMVGYSLQGAAKFGLYEIFKYVYASQLSYEFVLEHKTYIYLAASATAEFLADVLLAPWEAAKVRMQTTFDPLNRAVSHTVPLMWETEGLRAFYKGIVPLWLRQVPYTMVKFTCFERIVVFLYDLWWQAGWEKNEMPGLYHLLTSLLAGYVAGFLCAASTHPADTIVSKLNQVGSHSPHQHSNGVSSTPSSSAVAADNSNGGIAVTAAGGTASTIHHHHTSAASALASLPHSGGSDAGALLHHHHTLSSAANTAATATTHHSSSSTTWVSVFHTLTCVDLWKGFCGRVAMVGVLTAMQWMIYDGFKVYVGLPTTGGGSGRK